MISEIMIGNHAIRSRDWRYIRYADGAEELYDHRVDPDEYTNLADDPKHASVKADLARWLPEDPTPEVKPVSEQDRTPGRTGKKRE